MAKKFEEIPEGTLIRISRDASGRHYVARTATGEDVTTLIPSFNKKNAFKQNKALKIVNQKLEKVNMSEFIAEANNTDTASLKDAQLREFIANAPSIRPLTYKVGDLTWKFMIRSVLRGKNLLFTGPQGCGKTSGVMALAEVLQRKLFNIPLGAAQDARSTLIGNTHFKPSEGTYVAESEFVRAIQTPNAIVLLDEISRAHPDAMNILMSVLDAKQRFLRIDEKPDTPIIRVADGVTFMATANIGHQFTGTRTMDAALLDRFEIIEVAPLAKNDEIDLIRMLVPEVPQMELAAIASIAEDTRVEMKSEQPRLSTLISTRQTIRMAELIADGFKLEEAAEVVIYPFYSDAGGAESDRAYIKQIVQRYLPTNFDKKNSPFQTATEGSKKLPWDL